MHTYVHIYIHTHANTSISLYIRVFVRVESGVQSQIDPRLSSQMPHTTPLHSAQCVWHKYTPCFTSATGKGFAFYQGYIRMHFSRIKDYTSVICLIGNLVMAHLVKWHNEDIISKKSFCGQLNLTYIQCILFQYVHIRLSDCVNWHLFKLLGSCWLSK